MRVHVFLLLCNLSGSNADKITNINSIEWTDDSEVDYIWNEVAVT
jgi:hypothetical protein